MGLGSNLGNRREKLGEAIHLLKASGLNLRRASSLYESEPWGVSDQNRFLNAVIELDTRLAPWPLLELCQEVERKLGRAKTYKWGPRIIDIDILAYHDWQIRLPSLIIPHPFYMDRRFVLEPIQEIAPDWVAPGQAHSIQRLISNLSDPSIVRVSGSDWYDEYHKSIVV